MADKNNQTIVFHRIRGLARNATLIVYIFNYSLLISFTIEQIIRGRYAFQRNDYDSCKHYRTNQSYCECRKSQNCKKRIICNIQKQMVRIHMRHINLKCIHSNPVHPYLLQLRNKFFYHIVNNIVSSSSSKEA